MSRLVQQVTAATGASRADVVRVAREGGTTSADWDIACAIENAGGRRAADLMWGREHIPTQTPQAANPHAVYDPTIAIYSEDTAPDGPNGITPHHPHESPEPEPADDREAAEELATEVHADLAEVLSDPGAAARLTAAWLSPAEGRLLLHRVLRAEPRTRHHLPSIPPIAA